MGSTIAALATGDTAAAIGMIRVSGEDAIEIASAVFKPLGDRALQQCTPRHMYLGDVLGTDGQKIDHAMACVMEAPNSYTGENMVEIHCHGSVPILQETIHALYKKGAVAAKPGEFTQRAFANGKMDLFAVEAINDLITAQTKEMAQNAVAQANGLTGRKIVKIREEILSLVAHFYALVDYPDEDIDPLLFEQAQKTLHDAARDLYELAESYVRGKIMREGISCAILGKPNVGKSSLLNALVGFDRAIVTDIKGTTRDIIEESIVCGPLVLRVSDTAGLRETGDKIEEMGVNRALACADASAFAFAVFDLSESLEDEDLMVISRTLGKKSIAILNKCDLPHALDTTMIEKHFKHVVPISAKTGEGIKELRALVPEILGLGDMTFDGTIITQPRQATALATAAARCEDAFFAAQSGMTPDAVVMDAEGALSALGEITGHTVTDDIIDKIFSKFCVGK